VALVRTVVSEELIASIIKVKRIRELGITLTVTSNCSKLQRVNRLLEKQHGVTAQKTTFFIDTALKTANLT
jgi:3-deoxy-D-manno-octulosonate 8-phosphate phosphatase KdsC-like HAD superfamily phosphatase